MDEASFRYNLETPSVIDFNMGEYDVSSFVDLVLHERAYKLILEAKRWLDLKKNPKSCCYSS